MLAVLGGCGSGDGEAKLSVYLSTPLRGPSAGDGRDLADGARLALDEAGGEADGIAVDLRIHGDAGRAGSDPARAAANARTATEDSTAIAFIGELDSGTTRTSLPITNEAGMLQVSAGASAVDLTRSAPGSDQIPEAAQPSGARTFGRVVPSDSAQGAAVAASMARSSAIGGVFAWGSGSNYADSLLAGFDSLADTPPAVPAGAADAIYAVSERPGSGLPGGADRGITVYGADAQITGLPPSSGLPPGSTLVSGPQAPGQLPGAAEFSRRFRSSFGRGPGRFAAYGYEAMAVVLDAIGRAEDPLDRGAVIDAFFATADRESLLGTYSIDEVGDTTLPRVGAYTAREDGELEAEPGPLNVP